MKLDSEYVCLSFPIDILARLGLELRGLQFGAWDPSVRPEKLAWRGIDAKYEEAIFGHNTGEGGQGWVLLRLGFFLLSLGLIN